MKSFFKRSAISLVVLGMAGSAYAASHHGQYVSSNSSWCPQVVGAFIGVEGLDLRPMNGDLDYVTLFPTSEGDAFHTNNISTSYHWGWRVYGGIKVTDNDDLTVSWMHLDTNQSDATGLDAVSFTAAPRWLSNFTFIPWTAVTGHVTFHLDDAYAVWGHTVHFNNPWDLRFAGGVEYARIKSDLRVNGDFEPGVPPVANPFIGFESDSRTQGVGPRAEMDMTYHLPYNLAIFGHADAALLVSTREISLDPTNPDSSFDFFSNDYSTRHVVVPKFGARIGASYTYIWGQAGGEGCRSISLMVDAGWQVESYIHAIERPDDPGFSESGGLQVRTNGKFTSTKVSNFSDSGFFVGLQLGTDWV